MVSCLTIAISSDRAQISMETSLLLDLTFLLPLVSGMITYAGLGTCGRDTCSLSTADTTGSARRRSGPAAFRNLARIW
ncbi:hypothetical protein [Halomicrobium urmianum]|uniref:hypothetical protein n=1 Tax=Halomicrobium urmianum TaxID=1586233 RepID=UPI001CD9383F|nr:hypothetical protein [Halomicrobium urmianum]